MSSTTCTTCSKNPSDSSPLKFCAGCKATAYCSRECQRADWKTHKKTCSGASTNNPKPSNSSSSFPFQTHTIDPSTLQSTLAGDDLHTMSPEALYGHLIDSYRMRVEDEYTFRGDATGVYAGDSPVPGFRRFLEKAQKKKLLPAWWDKDKLAACVTFGMRKDHWFDLGCAVEKADVQEHYGDPLMPMKLRILAEKVTGSNVMG